MLREITLTIPSGTLNIADQNDDWMFEPTDRVTINGQSIGEGGFSPQVTKEILLTYGVDFSSLYGAHFKRLEDYLGSIRSCIDDSVTAAVNGNRNDESEDASCADGVGDKAENAGIPFDANRFMASFQEAHRTAHQKEFEAAGESAKTGDIDMMTMHLETARRLARQAKFPFDERRAAQITREGNSAAYEKILQELEQDVGGDYPPYTILIIDKIKEARKCARTARIAVDEKRVKDMLKRAYKAEYEGLPWEDAELESYHDLPDLVGRVGELRRLARRFGFEFDEKAARALVKAAQRLAAQQCDKQFAEIKSSPAGGYVSSADIISADIICTLAAKGGAPSRTDQIDQIRHRTSEPETTHNYFFPSCPNVPFRVRRKATEESMTTAIETARQAAREGNGEMIDEALADARRCAALGHFRFDEGIVRDPEIIGGWRLSSFKAFEKARSIVAGSGEVGEDVYDAKQLLKQARADAEHGGISFDEEGARQIIIAGYRKSYQRTIGEISESAGRGGINLDEMIEQARCQAVRAGISPDEEDMSRRIMAGYKTAHDCQLGLAREAAKEGNIQQLEGCIDSARNFARNAGITFDETWTKWPETKKAYETAYRKKLDEAEEFAYGEDVERMDLSLEEARGYATKAGVVFDDKRAARMTIKAARLAYRVVMRQAEALATTNDFYSMEKTLENARKLGQMAGMPPADIAPISLNMRRTYKLECDKIIARIGQERRRGSPDLLLLLFCDVYRCARLAGVHPDEMKIGKTAFPQYARQEFAKLRREGEREKEEETTRTMVIFNLDWLDGWLERLLFLANETGISFDRASAAETKTRICSAAYEKWMQRAEKDLNPEPAKLAHFLEEARKYAEAAGIPFDEQREKNIYRNAFALVMQEADAMAGEKSDGMIFGYSGVDDLIQRAREFTQKAGDRFDESQLSQNLKRYYSRRHSEAMQEAGRLATAEDNHGIFYDDVDKKVDAALEKTRQYTVLAGFPFDEQAATRVRTMF